MAHAQLRELPGYQRAVLVVEHRAHAHRAALRVDLVIDELEAAAHRRAAVQRGLHLDGDSLLHVFQGAHHRLLVGVEARIDRIDRDERGQHRRARSRRDQVAHRDLEPAHAARHRRAHLRIAEVEAGGLQRGLRRAQVGIGFLPRVRGAVELALRDGALVPQALRPGVLARRVADARLRRHDLRLQALGFRRVGRRIDGDQQVVALHQRTLGEVHRLHRTGDARAHVDALDRLEAARELVPHRHLGLHQRRHRHRRSGRRGGGRGLGFGARGAQVERPPGNGNERCQRRRGEQPAAGGELNGSHRHLSP